MGRKIFVSYKYGDWNVSPIDGKAATVRDYVNKLQDELEKTDHIYKGEGDDEDLSNLSDETIWSKLKDRIYDSSITIVFISPNMKELGKTDRNQWIPWEISYSLKEESRKNEKGDIVTSHTNAMLAVVLPDVFGKYDYFVVDNNCCENGCRTLKTDTLFYILRENMFNQKNPNKHNCEVNNSILYRGESSYIKSVKWKDFIDKYNIYIDKAVEIADNIEDYDICKEVDEE